MKPLRPCAELECLLALILTAAICTTLTLGAGTDTKLEAARTLTCRVRVYTYTVIQPPYFTRDGRLLQCSGEVTVTSCWGRCESSEIADYRIPYKESYHPVCMYEGKQRWLAPLNNCHPEYPRPLAEVFNATRCVCRSCPRHDASCETLHT